jgi:nitrite reductase/ring-hydroxylating ferredoxin subunit
MKRRDFIKESGMTCMALAGMGFLLTECKSASVRETDKEVIVPISLMKKKNNLIVSSKNVAEKILLVKNQDGTYHSLLLKCTHKGAALKQEEGRLVCPAHGSTFDLEGNVTNKPAKTELKKFPVTSNESEIVIHLV